MRTTVVLPTYNESENLERFLRRLRAEAPDVAILVVDDESPDGTGAIADRLAAELGCISVMHRAGDRGLGNAYRAGFAHVLDEGVDVVVSMDADFSHDPSDVPRLVAELDRVGADMVIGSRYVPGGAVVNWPAHRRWLSRWGNRYTAWALGLEVRDCTSGFRAYRADVLRSIDVASTTAEGYAFLTELVRRSAQRERTVAECAITFVDREAGESKMSWRIIVESMGKVTRWGVSDRGRRLRARWAKLRGQR